MQRRRCHRWTEAVAGLLLLIIVVLPHLSALSEEANGTITGDGVTTRTGPGVEYEKVGRLHTGARVTVLERSGKWLRVIDPGEREVWVFARWVDAVPVPPAPEAVHPSEAEPAAGEALPMEQKPESAEAPPVKKEPEPEGVAPAQRELDQSVPELEPAVVAQETTAVEPPPLVEEGKKRVPWMWIGAGAAAAGVVGYFALAAEEEESDTGALHIHVVFP